MIIMMNCDFCCSLVDRIVPGYPRAEAEAICNKLGYQDNLLDSAEKFLFWAIEYQKRSYEDELPTGKAGLNFLPKKDCRKKKWLKLLSMPKLKGKNYIKLNQI